LKGTLIWTIQDFLGYGTVARVIDQGFVACPICGSKFKMEHSLELGNKPTLEHVNGFHKGIHIKTTRIKDHFNGQLETYNGPKTSSLG
jgi:hypothetical protein